jgi:prepilin-type N-terminal cleavage/methylation domain-containing protein
MEQNRNILTARSGFSLAEVLAAMMIGSMVLIAVLTVYTRVERTAAAVTRDMSSSRLPYEALQLIAEDLDKMISIDSDTTFIMLNRHINNYAAAIFAMREYYKDSANKDQTYKEILWQCNAYNEGDVNDMVLYRSYESIAPQDKLLDKDKEALARSAYVPICRGVTYFSIEIITEKKGLENGWPGGIPQGAVFHISFAKPYLNAKGQYEVPENEIYSRTIAFDKSRNIKFVISDNEPNEPDEEGNNITDTNPPVNQDTSAKPPIPTKQPIPATR